MFSIDTKKAGQLYLSLVPLIEAFALPITVERATQKPTPNEIYKMSPDPLAWTYIYTLIGIYRCFVPWQ